MKIEAFTKKLSEFQVKNLDYLKRFFGFIPVPHGILFGKKLRRSFVVMRDKISAGVFYDSPYYNVSQAP